VYHWLEVGLSGYHTPGGVPPEAVGWEPIRASKAIVIVAFGLVLAAVGWRCWRTESAQRSEASSVLALLRLAVIPFAAYLLLATTIHPWYVPVIIPLLPFLLPAEGEASHTGRFLWPWLYFSLAVSLSYLSYVDPDNPREYSLVRLVEYLPLYLLLIWAAWGSVMTRRGRRQSAARIN
jgi:RsiW-degrading membrane proteinase PrsW (M82 family)